MVDKSYIRTKIINTLDPIVIDNELKMQLDSLDILSNTKTVDMKTFNSNFARIISDIEIRSIQYNTEIISTNEAFKKIISIIVWAKKLWEENISSGNLDKMVISFIVVERLYLNPEEDLSWKYDFTKIKQKLKKALAKLKFDISDQISERAGYSDRKFQSDYRKALRTNNYKGIFQFINALDRGFGLHCDGAFLKVLIRISSIIDIKLLEINIGKYSPPLMFLVFNTLHKNKALELLEVYSDQNLLPLLMGFRKLLEEDVKQKDDITWDWVFIERCSKILDKIAANIKEISLFKFITTTIGINQNKNWHLFFTVFISRNDKYIADYSSNIDFTYNDNGKDSFAAFKYFGNDDKLSIISKEIFTHFISQINSKEFHQHPFIFSNYCHYFLHAISAISEKDYSKYLQELEQKSISLLRCLYSWNLKNKDQHFTQLIYWFIAAKYFIPTEEYNRTKLSYTYKILNDERIMNLIKTQINDTVVNFDELQLLLEDPENVHKIILPVNDRIIELQWI